MISNPWPLFMIIVILTGHQQLIFFIRTRPSAWNFPIIVGLDSSNNASDDVQFYSKHITPIQVDMQICYF